MDVFDVHGRVIHDCLSFFALAAAFHLHGVERDDVDHILDTFPIVRRRDEQRFGEYRTKRVVLEIYDAMVASISTGAPYRTVVDSPTGHGPWHPAGSVRRS
jgi:hypothetical protein